MIAFYLLVSVMPLIRHPFWSSFAGDLTMVKYLGLACLIYSLLYLPGRRTSPTFLGLPLEKAFVAFALLGAGSYLAFGSSLPFEISPFMSFSSIFLFYLVTRVVLDSLARLRYTLLVAIASVAYASLHVLYEWQKYGHMAAAYRPGWVTGDPNYYSLSALLCLPLSYYLLAGCRAQWQRWICVGSIAITLPALILAASRGALVGLAVGLAMIAVRSSRRARTLTALVVILAPALLLAPSSPLQRLLNPTRADLISTDARAGHWAAALEMIREHWLLGVGAGNFKSLAPAFGLQEKIQPHIAHNTYLEIAAEMGLPGLILFGLVIAYAFGTLRRVARRTKATGPALVHAASQGIQTALASYLVSAVFLSAQYQKLFWLIVFVTMCLPDLAMKALPVAAPVHNTTHRLPARPTAQGTTAAA